VRRLDDVRLAVMMLDGMQIAERCHVVALDITTEDVKISLGLWEGLTENATLARTLLADLVDRGLDEIAESPFIVRATRSCAPVWPSGGSTRRASACCVSRAGRDCCADGEGP
jgi:hypothetical protein